MSSQFFRDTSHILSYGDEVDAKVGEHFLSYTISSAMQEMAPSNSLTSHGITVRHTTHPYILHRTQIVLQLAHDKLIEQASTPQFLAGMWQSQEARGARPTGGENDEGDLVDVEMFSDAEEEEIEDT